MKLFKYLSFVAAIMSVVSCRDDEEFWTSDIYPLVIQVDIYDEYGYNLLGFNYDGIIDKDNLESEISYVYEGETKPLFMGRKHVIPEEKSSRAYLPRFYGLSYNPYDNVIEFGEFDGAQDNSGSFTICWPDGTSDTVSFRSKAFKVTTTTEISVNGGEWQKTKKVYFWK